jgi:hypothetical protein
MSLPISARRIGREGEPVVVVDDFAPDPQALRVHAAASAFTPAGDHYPGLRAPLPKTYLGQVSDTMAIVFKEAFGATGRVRVLDARFSIVTATEAELTLVQRLPHVDATVPGRLAMVHYLAAEEWGGTQFYRHRSTGFETINEGRSGAYLAALERETALHPPQGYIDGDTPLFERIDVVSARFNRAVFYRSHLLHSGAVPSDAVLPADPATGRLTVTGFFDAD